MKFILLVMLFLTGCASDAFREDLLADGKTWRVESPDYKCELYKRDGCQSEFNKAMGLHSQMLCGGPDYRLFSCNSSEHQGFRYVSIHSKCLMQCHKAADSTP